MNIAHILIPKQDVAYMYDDFTLRQGLEKMKNSGYAAIPVINRMNKYAGTVSEGDFLWYLIDEQKEGLHKVNKKNIEGISIKKILRTDSILPVRITATIEELLAKVLNNNFIPVVDDRNIFIGIITRRDIIKYFTAKR